MMRLGRLLALAGAAVLLPSLAMAADTIKIGFPIPLSGPTASYGEPILKGAQMAVSEINEKGGVLGQKLELLPRDSKANADEAVRLARELIVKDGVQFLIGTLTSAEAPAVSSIAKENKIVFLAPSSKAMLLTSPANIHPYVFRVASTTSTEGQTGAILVSKWKDVKKIATIAPDYAYGHDIISAFTAALKRLRPDIQVVDEEWPKLGEPDLTPFITAQMSKQPDAVYCALFSGDFITLVKQGTPLGYFKAINNRLADGGEVGAVDITAALGNEYPLGIWADAYDPVVWPGGNEPPEHKAFITRLKAFMKSDVGSGWAIQGYSAVEALVAGIQKAGSTNSDKVAAALAGITYETPLGPRTFDPKTHNADAGEYWGVMEKDAQYPYALISSPEYFNPAPLTD